MKTLKNNQQGMAAIITTLVIMLLVTLIVSSFALIVRKEQRQSLDRQLSTQALYAAEVGIEDAAAAISEGRITSDITDCSTFTTAASVIEGNISYSCVLVDWNPENLQFTDVNPASGSLLFPLESTAPLNSITVSWQNSDNSTNFNTNPHQLPQNATLPTGLVRATLIPGDTLSRSSFASAKTLFLYPDDGGGGSTTINYGSVQSGHFVTGNCNTSNQNATSYACRVTLSGLPGNSKYYLHLKPLYHTTNFYISGELAGGTTAELSGAQATIDATGRAADVLRRIRVSKPVGGAVITRSLSNIVPEGAIETTDELCKLLEYYPGTNERVKNNCLSPATDTPL